MNVQTFTLENLENYNIKNSLVFIFSDEENAEKIIKKVYNHSKNSTIIFLSSSGEIFNEKILKNSTLITSLSFEKTQFEAHYSFNENSFKNGENLIKKFSKKPDLLILFLSAIDTNAEDVLEGIKSVYNDLKIVGSLAGYEKDLKKSFIGLNNQIFNKGVIGVGLFNKSLDIEIHSFLGWIPIGISHKVTKAYKNIVYEIDSMPAIELYKQYLGKKLISKFPKIGIEFPLLIKRKQKFIARAILDTKEKSLILGGNIKEGDIVHIGIGYPKLILKNHLKKFKIQNPEIFLIFSCMARKNFIGDSIKEEIVPFAKTALSVGFFGYGEIKNYIFLNQTITIAAISENKNKKKEKFLKEISSPDTFVGIINILNNVIKQLKIKEKHLKSLEHELQIKTNLLNRLNILGKIGSFEVDLKKGEILFSEEVKSFLSKNNCNRYKKLPKIFIKRTEKRDIVFY